MQKLWVQHQTIPKTYGPTKVSIDGCEYVDDFLKQIKKATQLAIPPNTPITLYKPDATQPDGVTEIDVGDSPADYVTENSRKNPLIVKTTTVSDLQASHVPEDIKPISKANFEFYAWKATKNPYKIVALDLIDGRIPLRALLQEEGIINLYRMDSDGLVLLLADRDGLSIQKWVNNQTYRLKVKAGNSIDIETTFSEKDPEKMNILIVRDDFNITFDDTLWECSNESIQFPDALFQALALFAEFNTLRLEQSRRSIVSLFLHFAISTISVGKSKLCIDEKTPLAIVRNVIREGAPKTVRYSGPVDFVIGHSKMASNMPKDAAVMVIETKKSDTFDGSLPQVTAQAAALLYFRRGMKPPRGLNGSGGPIIFIRTDGERWIFSKMTCEEGVPKAQHSEEFKINICKNTIENATVQKVFDWLRYAITIGRDSSPGASTEQVNPPGPNDEETITAEFSCLKVE